MKALENPKGENMNTIKLQTSFKIEQSAEVLFPLFNPEGEKLWMPGYDYENIMGETDVHEDYIFLAAGHNPWSSKEIWLVKRFEPSIHLVQCYKVVPYDAVTIVTIQCKPITDALTEVEISNEHFGLSERGNEFVKGRTVEAFEAFMAMWKEWLEAYFEAKPA
jgi:hypothetical protein